MHFSSIFFYLNTTEKIKYFMSSILLFKVTDDFK